MLRAQQQLADLEKRKAEVARSAAAAAVDFAAECKALGVDPRAIRPSLLALAARLPAVLGSAVAQLRAEGVSEGMEYYAAFVGASASGDGGSPTAAANAPTPAELLPTLAEVREGRAAPPSAEVLAALDMANSAGEAAAADDGGIDWGGSEVSGAGAAPGGGVSWDIATKAKGGEAGSGITWDFELQAEAPLEDAGSGDGAEGAEPAGISWDIDVSGAGETATPEDSQLPAASPLVAAAEGPVTAVVAAEAAASTEVRRLIADHEYRSCLLDDLHELLAFLTQVGWRNVEEASLALSCCRPVCPTAFCCCQTSLPRCLQRCSELSANGSELLAANGPDAVARVSADMAAGMRDAVRARIADFDDEALRRLLAIRTSARHVDRLVAALGKKSGQEAKFER